MHQKKNINKIKNQNVHFKMQSRWQGMYPTHNAVFTTTALSSSSSCPATHIFVYQQYPLLKCVNNLYFVECLRFELHFEIIFVGDRNNLSQMSHFSYCDFQLTKTNFDNYSHVTLKRIVSDLYEVAAKVYGIQGQMLLHMIGLGKRKTELLILSSIPLYRV